MKTPTAADIAYWEAHVDDNAIPGIFAANLICLVGAYIAIGLRLYSRRLVRAPLKADDWLVIVSGITATLYVAAYCVTTRYNFGRHTLLVTDVHGLAVSIIVASALYVPPIATFKLSVLCLYRRIFPSNVLKRWLIAIGLFVLLYSTAAVFVVIFQCYPIESNWDPTISGTCVNYGTYVLVIGILNIASDIAILTLPLPSLWRLQMPRSQKWVLSGLFLLGGTVCVISIVRLFFLQIVQSTADPAWDDVNGANLSTIEICVGIVSACLPTYRPLYKLFRHGDAHYATTGRRRATGYQDLPHGDSVKSNQNRGIEMSTSTKAWAEPHTNSVSDDREILYPSHGLGN